MVKGFEGLTAVEARAIDAEAKAIGISALVLMENAGRAVAEEAVRMLGEKRSVGIFCGKGNNGGDGFTAARHLLSFGLKPDVFLVGRIEDAAGEAGVNLKILQKLKQEIVEVDSAVPADLDKRLSEYDLIVDALLGVGLSGVVRGVTAELISLINSAGKSVLSVDIPSGLDAATGEALGEAVKASRTVTFVAPKRGMLSDSGAKYCGEVIVKPIGDGSFVPDSMGRI